MILKMNQLSSKTVPSIWLNAYPHFIPLNFVVRDLADNHVRLHWLANSLQFPKTNKDFQEIYLRMINILNFIFGDLIEARVVFTIFKKDFESFDNLKVKQKLRELIGINKIEVMDEINLGKIELLKDFYDDYPKDPILLKFAVSIEELNNENLNNIIKHTTTEYLTNVFFMKEGCKTFVTIYQGGFDILLPSIKKKNQLIKEFKNWLPRQDMPYG